MLLSGRVLTVHGSILNLIFTRETVVAVITAMMTMMSMTTMTTVMTVMTVMTMMSMTTVMSMMASRLVITSERVLGSFHVSEEGGMRDCSWSSGRRDGLGFFLVRNSLTLLIIFLILASHLNDDVLDLLSILVDLATHEISRQRSLVCHLPQNCSEQNHK